MTQEQKAKRYDEAINRMKHYVVDEYGCSRIKVADVFPNLEESENIRIIKAIKYGLDHVFTNNTTVFEVTKEQCLAWLEKQCNNMGISEATKRELEDNLNKALEKETAESWNEFLEKQGEQKPTDTCDSLIIKSKEFPASEKRDFGYFSEPTDKVEPKFKIGDWVVSPNGVYWHIDAINNNRYEVSSTDGTCADWPLDTDLYHLWTIQDAKDGDVLVSKSPCGLGTWYCIFKSLDGDESMTVYCYLARDGRFETKKELCFDKDPYNTIPATKEQRDTLLKAMTDAGYTFDFEKKELKKIEQNPAEEYNITGIGSKNAQGKLGEMIKNLKPINEVLEQKPAWSEEDEERLKRICKLHLRFKKGFGATILQIEEDIAWLKSIKDRVQPQPKQEWSEEDEKKRKGLIKGLEDRMGFGWASDPFSREEYIDWLKSLRPQSTWKPSDEQMNLLEELVEDNNQRHFYTILRSLYEQLQKLVE